MALSLPSFASPENSQNILFSFRVRWSLKALPSPVGGSVHARVHTQERISETLNVSVILISQDLFFLFNLTLRFIFLLLAFNYCHTFHGVIDPGEDKTFPPVL